MRERRFVRGAEVRAKAESGHIDGHAAVFNEMYVLMDFPDFRVEEIIKPGAFERAINERQDVRALFNHDPNYVLGRTSANTLSLKEDRQGLYFDNTPPDTQTGRDVRTLIERGDITGCSFAFEVTKQTRREKIVDKQMIVTREIEDVNLFDVGPVTYPAYESTDVNARQVDFRGLFPNGYPEPMCKHLADLGLPPDLQRPTDKRAVQVDDDPSEIAELGKQVEDMRETILEQQALLDEYKGKLEISEARTEKTEQEIARLGLVLMDERKAFAAEKDTHAAAIKRALTDIEATVTLCRAVSEDISRRTVQSNQRITDMQSLLASVQEIGTAFERELTEERAAYGDTGEALWMTRSREDIDKAVAMCNSVKTEIGHRARVSSARIPQLQLRVSSIHEIAKAIEADIAEERKAAETNDASAKIEEARKHSNSVKDELGRRERLWSMNA